jgi:hypothetical protein
MYVLLEEKQNKTIIENTLDQFMEGTDGREGKTPRSLTFALSG